MTTALILDTETDSKTDPRPIQVAFINPDSGLKFMKYYHSGRDICPATMAVHHISNEDVVGKQLFTILEVPPMDYMIGHNIDYDWQVVGAPDCKRICTLALARTYCPEWSGHSLGACVYHILPAKEAKKLTKDAHDALADVEANWVVYKHLCERLGLAEDDYENIWAASEDARIPRTMPFGKHRGVPMHELPPDYVNWALTNLTDIDPYLRMALERITMNHYLL